MPPANKLFSIHVWAEEVADGTVEWRGRVTSQPAGTVAYFRKWTELIQHMQLQLDDPLQRGTTQNEGSADYH